MKQTESNTIEELQKKLDLEGVYPPQKYPKVSIIIPTFNCMQSIDLTLDRILIQNYPNYEIIIVDAGSTDQTLDVIAGYKSSEIILSSVTNYQRYEMLNKGISLAEGEYLNFLFPGDFYISQDTLHTMMTHALDQDMPYLVFCGSLLRDGKSEVKILYRHLSLSYLKNGQQPTSLQACWFRKEVFQKLDKFNTSLEMRGGYDLLCRYALYGHFKTISTSRVLTDYDLRFVTRKMVIKHFWETFRIIYHYFGLLALLGWLGKQKDFARYMKLWLRSLRGAFLGKLSEGV